MAKFNGFPGMGGGAGNMANLLKQAQKMQSDMMKTHTEIEEREFEVATGGGAVTIIMTGKKTIKSIKIKPEVIDKDDPEMLEDLVMTAVNEGIKKADDMMEEEMKKYNIPSGLNGLL
ncbi:MAG: YbaB/EbfC family nucleoid-associated protein [Clostridia bacterium]|nr:YbaB/EbfC family nucleoid-associated protein [Clostridia bacterium]